MIPDIAQKIGQNYGLALLPYGPHFYTGILQSSGYLLLPEKKSVLFLIPQQTKANEVYQLTGTIGPILGRSRDFHETSEWNTTYQPDIEDLGTILQHLAFLHTTTQTETISCLAIGDTLTLAKQKKLTTYLTNCLPTTNIVFLSNFTTNFKEQAPDLLMLAATPGLGVIQSFQSVAKKIGRKPEIIAYTSIWSPKAKKTTWYACILA